MPSHRPADQGVATALIARQVGALIVLGTQLWTGLRALWIGCRPSARQRLYFGNHASHGDFVMIWGSLPAELRRLTRPVAGQDYWLSSSVRRLLATRVFQALLIDRQGGAAAMSPIDHMIEALEAGHSLILFPEGTRNTTEADLLPFKSGLFHLSQACTDTELIPVWIDNARRVMPKGELIPLPLICTVSFGAPLPRIDGEPKSEFLARAQAAVLSLKPIHATN